MRYFASSIALASVYAVVLAGCGASADGATPDDDGIETDAGPADSGTPDSAPPTPPAPTFSIGGTVSGLAGTGLMLTNNGAEALAVGQSGAFAFPTKAKDGADYAVAVQAQPTSPKQTCNVTKGFGQIAAANVTDVAVECVTNTYTVGGTVTGLSGTGLVLQNNAGNDLTIGADGTFTFTTPVADGAAFAVTVMTQPEGPSQTCTVSGGSGTLAGGNVTSVLVNCTVDSFAIGGSVSGLAGSGLVLQNNGGDDLSVSGNTFAFATPLLDQSSYAVTVQSQPTSPWQTCSVANASGTVAGSAVSDVAVSCTTNTYSVGGNVIGLKPGRSVVFQNNGADDITRNTNGSFTFPTPVASGATYTTTVLTQPADQTCNVTNGTGTVTNAAVNDVAIDCRRPVCADWSGDNFDDGDANGWSVGSSGTASVTTGAAADGSAFGYQLTGAATFYQGARYSFPAKQVRYLSAWLKADNTSAARSYLVLGDDSTATNNGVLFMYANNAGSWRVFGSTGNNFMPVVAGEWVHFEFYFDWTAKTYDVVANGTTVVTAFPFRTASTSVTQLHFFNLDTTATAAYDQIYLGCD